MPYDNTIIGWMTEQDLQAVESIATTVQPNSTLVELGSMFGRSTTVWALTAPPSTKIYCVDMWHEHSVTHEHSDIVAEQQRIPISGKVYDPWAEFCKNTDRFDNIHKIRGHSPDGIKYPGDAIDVFFLDGLHANPSDWDNICYFVPFIKQGGILCGHDYIPHLFPDVITNVAKLEQLLDQPVTRYQYSSVWSFTMTRQLTEQELRAAYN